MQIGPLSSLNSIWWLFWQVNHIYLQFPAVSADVSSLGHSLAPRWDSSNACIWCVQRDGSLPVLPDTEIFHNRTTEQLGWHLRLNWSMLQRLNFKLILSASFEMHCWRACLNWKSKLEIMEQAIRHSNRMSVLFLWALGNTLNRREKTSLHTL